MNRKPVKILILSDGTGETATSIVRATLVQYEDENVETIRYPNVRTEKQISSILDQAHPHQTIIAYTMVLNPLRTAIQQIADQKKLPCIDLLGPLIQSFNKHLVSRPERKAGILHQVDEDYFKRIEAIEFSLKYDDGSTLHNLQSADIVLIGVSRTSKTPLSIFLSYKGYKVANIPFVKDIKLPTEIFKVDSKKIIALTIDGDVLLKIRKNRLQKIGVHSKSGDYADKLYVYHELEQARGCFEKYRWPVVNVTDRALEETAADILRIIRLRQNQS